ncbi:MAG: hypothetical protein HY577_02500 [Candidatus Nealsonbacteria bacterium]|nr:hypothetical protein [Candidatus Nealsonbacteria bacterium]
MKFVADFHIHSRFSRATSKEINLENLARWASVKGISLLGTGDFTHPVWFKELKEGLEPAEPGLFKLKPKTRAKINNGFGAGAEGTRFILTTEISCIYSKNNRVRKIHLLVISPSLESVEKINSRLEWVGNLKADGRPILGIDAKELTKIILQLSPASVVVPAHCLLPDAYIHSKTGMRQIKDIKIGDFVYTHTGKTKRVENVLKRAYHGLIYTIRPSYFRLGLATTPEHPYLAMRNDCYQGQSNYYGEQLKREYFRGTKPQWIPADKIKIGDILLFPRFRNIKDQEFLDLTQVVNPIPIKFKENKIAPIGFKVTWLPQAITVDKDFCRLVGYYLSEGYTNNRDAIAFCFSDREKEYIADLQSLMKKIFDIEPSRIVQKEGVGGVEIIYFSKILYNAFGHLFYSLSDKKAHSKMLPTWMLELPLEKQVEIFRGWWRGDHGSTVSRTLMNQMKIILLRLGVVPSINVNTRAQYEKRGRHFINGRKISANNDLFMFSRLSFFEDKFNLLREKEFAQSNYKTIRKNGWIDENYIYLPVRNIDKNSYRGDVFNLEVKEDNSYITEFATVHNCWTPWFSVFGSKSGFDSVEECFEDYSRYIFALETGLSSDPKMNWRLSALDQYTLISNSDSHSLRKIGREANVFEGAALSYPEVIKAIKKMGQNLKLIYTIEFFPEEGKYHYDGHRLCQVSFSPEQTKKSGGTCPVCGKSLTIGVLSRVEELADRPEGSSPVGRIPFKSLVPLEEIIAEALGLLPGAKKVEEEYHSLIKKMGSEFSILTEASLSDLTALTLPEIAEGISRVREGRLVIEPGYDGLYGRVRIFNQGEQKIISKQKSLF